MQTTLQITTQDIQEAVASGHTLHAPGVMFTTRKVEDGTREAVAQIPEVPQTVILERLAVLLQSRGLSVDASDSELTWLRPRGSAPTLTATATLNLDTATEE